MIMYDTMVGFQPTRHYKLCEKPKSISWKKLNREKWENKKHWLCFNLPEISKTFNVYYPLESKKGEKIVLLINPNNYIDDWDNGLYQIEWIEGKLGLFEQLIKPKLCEWIVEMSNKNEETNILP